jgi:hypothetical protein
MTKIWGLTYTCTTYIWILYIKIPIFKLITLGLTYTVKPALATHCIQRRTAANDLFKPSQYNYNGKQAVFNDPLLTPTNDSSFNFPTYVSDLLLCDFCIDNDLKPIVISLEVINQWNLLVLFYRHVRYVFYLHLRDSFDKYLNKHHGV